MPMKKEESVMKMLKLLSHKTQKITLKKNR